ncbi:MAG: YfcE family phosphodiesterase [Gammaproteobacteria bacterium]|nr:YfcE family phosphodiesterase [Gammaproteobacteria bacterium]
MARTVVNVLIVADTHGELDARVLALARDCEHVVHAGDIGARAVLEQLAGEARTVTAVRGNNDVAAKWSREEANVLAALPEVATLELPGGTLAVVHGDRHGSGSTRHRRLRRQFADAALVVYGHSHRLFIDQTMTPWIVNPGAAGRVRTYGGPSALRLEARARGPWSVHTYRFERR